MQHMHKGVQRACTTSGRVLEMQQVFKARVHDCSLTRSHAAQRRVQLAPVEQVLEKLGGFPLQPSCLL